ncbi:MAG: hypothetical protein EZS28_014012 [Streblomastix strix]|uniref:Uncharacterized protein n=1 Tax=Streblomastix strix TaxID=222440 RepID=A0A5J4W6B3_9EUKA|nr:MAG: hypothetical protein EZS28_014012 [Streblomastix strix]
MEKDLGLFPIKQITLCDTFYNGGYLESKIYLITQRLDDQNGPRVCISPHLRGQGTQAIPGLHLQLKIFPLQSHVF